MVCVRATCVSLDGVGVLLRGPSGCGKSDLALRLLAHSGSLVADDYTDLTVREGRLYATAPAAIAGLIEIRGVGVAAICHIVEVEVRLVIDLVTPSEVERMPEKQWCEVVTGIFVCRFALAAFEASATAKVAMAVQVVTNRLQLIP